MQEQTASRARDIRVAIETFLQERLDGKLKGLPDDDPKRAALTHKFSFSTWIDNAARRAAGIQLATHPLKGGHSCAKGSSVYAPPGYLPDHGLVGSRCLSTDDYAIDVVCNAADLDVFAFLRLPVHGRTLLDWINAGDKDLLEALSNDEAQGRAWVAAFSSVSEARGKPTTHTLAKQLYWLVGDSPTDNAAYHLLAPLYASSLAHQVFRTINADRFSDEAKAARNARHHAEPSERDVHEYPNLAVQTLGGSNKQNVSMRPAKSS